MSGSPAPPRSRCRRCSRCSCWPRPSTTGSTASTWSPTPARSSPAWATPTTRPCSRQGDPRRHRGGVRAALPRQHLAPHVAAALGRRRAVRAVRDHPRADRADGRPGDPGQPQRPGPRGPLHQGQHRRDPRGVRSSTRSRSHTSRARRSPAAAGSTTLDGMTSSVPLVDPQIVSEIFEQQQQVRAYYSVQQRARRRPLRDRRHRPRRRARRARARPERNRRRATATGPTSTPSTPTATASSRRTPTSVPRTTPRQSIGIQWAEGAGGRRGHADQLAAGGYETRVYFGEQSPDYSIVGKAADGERRGARPAAGATASEEDARRRTTVRAGVPVGGLFNQLLYAVRFSEPNFLLSSRVNENSKVLYDRNPRTMVEKVAPWLTVDSDPYPAVVDGRIQWILDGYTVTDKYPLSQRESLETMTDDSLQRTTRLPDPAHRRDQLPAQLGQGDGRRLRRHRDALRVGRGGPDPQGVGGGLPRRRPAQGRRSPTRSWSTCAIPRTSSRPSATSSSATTRPRRGLVRGLEPLGGPEDPQLTSRCSRRTASSPTPVTARRGR